ncbi:unnamed protein product [Lactuca virosa]|uniref:Auxin efflux carrier component n=1 Tax=Lactuca virosa TaxID=75947 RepID=A0AAU9LF11_9ASTR|nr:unnamed protein product [Lactuca virosa]
MISWHDFSTVVTAMAPLYVTMFLAYDIVKWWKIFTPDQCSGINRFVAIFAVPFLSFHFISMNDPYTMNFRFLAADTLQKIIMLLVIGLWAKFTKSGSLEWMITIFSLSTLPNTLVIGVPLVSAMYGDFTESLMVQVLVLQCIIWYTLLLVLFEFRGAKMLIMEQFPKTGGHIVSVKVDTDVVSLDGQDLLESVTEIGGDRKLHIMVRKSKVSRNLIGVGSLSGAEIYSISSPAIQTPKGSNVNQPDFLSITGFSGGRLSSFGSAADLCSFQLSMGLTSRLSSYENDPTPVSSNMSSTKSGLYHATCDMGASKIFAEGTMRKHGTCLSVTNGQQNKVSHNVQKFPRSSSAPTEHSYRPDQHGAKEIRMLVSDDNIKETEEVRGEIGGDKERIKLVLDSAAAEHHPKTVAVPDEGSAKRMPAASVMIRLILMMVWRKLSRNPDTYASNIGLIWSLVSFRCHVQMPKIIGNSISLISNAGFGMAMFSLGLFMALQPKIIACGRSKAALGMGVKFLIGPMKSLNNWAPPSYILFLPLFFHEPPTHHPPASSPMLQNHYIATGAPPPPHHPAPHPIKTQSGIVSLFLTHSQQESKTVANQSRRRPSSPASFTQNVGDTTSDLLHLYHH